MILLNLSKISNIFFAQESALKFYAEIKNYLPKKRFKQFMRSWVLNNIIKGTRKRRKLEKKYKCDLPSLINISPTENCNLSCRGCYASNYSRDTEMTSEQLDRIILECKRHGVFFLGILGGEPLMRPDIFPVLEKHQDIAIRISSNGTIFNSEIMDFLKRAGNVVLFFSLEGLQKETDDWRGEGVFEQIQQNMQRLKQERILFGFSALLHRENKDLLVSKEFLDQMEDLGNKFGLFFPYGPVGEKPDYDFAIDEEELIIKAHKLETVSKNYSMILMIEGFDSPYRSKKYLSNQGCQAGRNIHITPSGNVEPCNGIQFYTENIFKKSLVDILNSPFYKGIRSTTEHCNSRCLAIYEPEQLIKSVESFNAHGSTPISYPLYRMNAEVYSRTKYKPLISIVEHQINE